MSAWTKKRSLKIFISVRGLAWICASFVFAPQTFGAQGDACSSAFQRSAPLVTFHDNRLAAHNLVNFTADGAMMAALHAPQEGPATSAITLDLQTGQRAERSLPQVHPNVFPPPLQIALSPDQSLYNIVDWLRGEVTVQSIDGAELYKVQEPTKLTAVAFSHDSTFLATASTSGAVSIRVAKTGHLSKKIQLAGRYQIASLAFSPNGKWLAVSGTLSGALGIASNYIIELGSDEEPQLLQTFNRQPIMRAEFSQDSTRFFTIAGGTDTERRGPPQIDVWDTETWMYQMSLVDRNISNDPRFAAYFADNNSIVIMAGAEHLDIWDLNESATRRGPLLASLGFNPTFATSQGTSLVALAPSPRESESNKIEIWDARENKLVKTLFIDGETVEKLFLNRTGTRLVAVTSSGQVQVWDISELSHAK